MKTEQKLSTPRSTQRFSEDFQRHVCEHYLRSNSSKEKIRMEFGIKGKSSLLYWLRKFGYVESQSNPNQEFPFMAKSKKRHLKILKKRMKT